MVVNHSSQQVVGSTDCVEVTGEMKVDIFHRNYLSVSAAGSTTFNTEYRSKRRLTESNHNVLAKLLHTVCQTYCSSSLTFTGRCRVDGGNQDQFTVGSVRFFEQTVVNFCFVFSVLLQVFVINACFFCDLGDREHFAFLCDLNVCFVTHDVSPFILKR